MAVRRVYVEKKYGFDVEASKLFAEITENLLVKGLTKVRIIHRYDIEGITDRDYEESKITVFSEPPVDNLYEENLVIPETDRVIAIEYLPGQYDQRADSAAQCIQFITHGERPDVKVAKLIVLSGEISDSDYQKIIDFVINPVETRQASLEKPETLRDDYPVPEDVKTMEGFIEKSAEELKTLMDKMGFAMSIDDLSFCQEYFRDVEERDPTVTELRMIDTYWSDHCRHTTFFTVLEDIEFDSNPIARKTKEVYGNYIEIRNGVYGKREKDITLMDIATLAMKHLKKTGDLDNLDESEEINACSIVVKAIIDDKPEEWLVMFKNETHNHPTEIEPFGGAATCLGGAIRDPLSGRSYVYQAMRVTGSADPRTPLDKTLPGKLPQRVITTRAAQGYSSYGNQIGLSTGLVAEIYHEDYVAKRMEIGAVVGAAPRNYVVRKTPEPGDIIILLGGRTGRDGCGGATGSSKEHTVESLTTCGAEVQKGNPPTERKIQRLFRKPTVTRMIKKCNDFGAGGVSVAIGELADSLSINLDAILKKYEGLDGTELAISESQERMAVVVAPENAGKFIEEARCENLEATMVAVVDDSGRLRMSWRGKTIVDISRDFLNTNGVKQSTSVNVKGADLSDNPIESLSTSIERYRNDPLQAWSKNLERLNVCSQKGLVECFDSTIGAGTVMMPYGGKYQLTPAEGMVAKLPVETGKTTTGTIMTYGFNPVISKWSPFHGAVYAVVESLARLVAIGGDYKQARLTFQEYFEKLGTDPEKWGKPLSALLGAFYVQNQLKVASIGGKDSMSGTFGDMHVPPTLVSFALAPTDITKVISPEFKKVGSSLVLLSINKDELLLPDFKEMEKIFTRINTLIKDKVILSASAIKSGGLAEAICKMAFGNGIGVKLEELSFDRLFKLDYGAILVEVDTGNNLPDIFDSLNYTKVGETISEPALVTANGTVSLKNLQEVWENPLESIFPTKTDGGIRPVKTINYTQGRKYRERIHIARPRVFIPVFPGTNCEYDVKRKFESAGAIADVMVLRNLTPREIEDSINQMKKCIDESNMIMIPGGFSAGDEPEGSGKFTATVFRNPYLAEAVMDLLNNRDGLILGICNGFQALVKLGLLPYGEIRPLDETSPTLTFNTIGRHVSRMVRTRVASNLSPWLSNVEVGDIYTVAVSHGEGRFVASPSVLEELEKNGQIATQYVDLEGNPTMDIRYNPNGSALAIEGITSKDGRIFGKMAHDERYTSNTTINIPGNKDQKIFESGVEYFL
ncbi:MAG TPA: phosphoribosylformylglycinamidine synthase [Clostridiaceae bacterium]|jgi:phosphoribosylformylglycinamidine synthase|nr:phosphoribosylformylglycinamidine synthase [Clostridiaceae bacterium]